MSVQIKGNRIKGNPNNLEQREARALLPFPLSYPVEILLILNIFIFILSSRLMGGPAEFTSIQMIDLGGEIPILVLRGQPWRLISALFLHASASHLIGNMIALVWYGKALLKEISAASFWCIYFLSGLAGNVLFLWIYSPGDVSVGASGAIFGIAGSLVGLELIGKPALDRMYVFGKLGIVGAALFVIFTVDSIGFHAKQICVAAHLGGAAGGIVLVWILNWHKAFFDRRKLIDTSMAGMMVFSMAVMIHPIARVRAPSDEVRHSIVFAVYSSGLAFEIYQLKKKHAELMAAMQAQRLSPGKAGQYLQKHLSPQLSKAQKNLKVLDPVDSDERFRVFYLSEMADLLNEKLDTSMAYIYSGNEDLLDRFKDQDARFDRHLSGFKSLESAPVSIEPGQDSVHSKNNNHS